MPLPTTEPSAVTSTASPASKSPSTATIPTGSRLEPLSRRTRAAPSSTTIWPWAGFAYLSQSLKLDAFAGLSGEAGADALARGRGGQRLRLGPVADHGRDSGLTCHLRRRDLAAHSARAESRGAVADLQCLQLAKSVTSSINSASGLARGSAVWRPSMSVSRTSRRASSRNGDLGGEEVVVAEGDLVGRRGVVLVDDRDDAPLDQPPQRLAGVEVVGARRDVRRASAAPARRACRARPSRLS